MLRGNIIAFNVTVIRHCQRLTKKQARRQQTIIIIIEIKEGTVDTAFNLTITRRCERRTKKQARRQQTILIARKRKLLKSQLNGRHIHRQMDRKTQFVSSEEKSFRLYIKCYLGSLLYSLEPNHDDNDQEPSTWQTACTPLLLCPGPTENNNRSLTCHRRRHPTTVDQWSYVLPPQETVSPTFQCFVFVYQ